MKKIQVIHALKRLVLCMSLGSGMAVLILVMLILTAPTHAMGKIASASATLIGTPNTPQAAPILNSIEPTEVAIGNSGLTLTLIGAVFSNTEPLTVEFGVSGAYTTTFVNSTTLQAFIPSDWFSVAKLSGYDVNLINGNGDGSAKHLFRVIEAPLPAPVLTAIQPTRTHTRTESLMFTLTGENFKDTDGLKVEFGSGGSQFTATVITSRTLQTVIPGSLLDTAKTVDVTLVNKDNLKSEIRKFTIDTQKLLGYLPLTLKSYTPPCNQNAIDCFEPNDTFTKAVSLALNTTITAFAKLGENANDFFTVTLKAGKDATFTLAGVEADSPNRDLDLFIYRGSPPDYNKPLAGSARAGINHESITYRPPVDEVYYVLVYAFNIKSDTQYTLRVVQP